MSSCKASTSTPVAHRRVPDLLQTNRNANARCSRLTAFFRASVRPTHYARKHAQALRLSVDIEVAAGLDKSQISATPSGFSVLDLDSSPITAAPELTDASSADIVAPVFQYALEVEPIGFEEKEENINDSNSPDTFRNSYDHESLDSLRPRISIPDGARVRMVAEAQQTPARNSPPTHTPRENAEGSLSPPRLDAPLDSDVSHKSWSPNIFYAPNSGISAGLSSNGPATPAEPEVAAEDSSIPQAGVKRKHEDYNVGIYDNDYEQNTPEKRPKYDHKL